MISTLINNVFVINLLSCVERKKHIINEFNNVGINNYEFFEAISSESSQVEKAINSDFIYRSIYCLRCNKPMMCSCNNRSITKNQIGNWMSYIKLMRKIVDMDYENLIMICEDDVKFMEDGMKIINNIINNDVFQEYEISLDKPLLIRVGSLYNKKKHIPLKEYHVEPKLTKKVFLANPCFLINKQFAKVFLDNLDKIKTTSDIYIHLHLPSKLKEIQHFSIEPQPVYELSMGEHKIFESTIR